MHAATPASEGRASPAMLPSSGPQYSCQAKESSHGYAKSRPTPSSLRTLKHRTPTKRKEPVPGRHAGLQHGQLRTPAAQSPLELETPFEMRNAKNSPEKSTFSMSRKGTPQFSGSKMSSPADFLEERRRSVSKTPEPPSPVRPPSSHSSLQWLRGCLDKDKNSTSQSGLKLSYAAAAAGGSAQLLTPAHSQGSSSGTYLRCQERRPAGNIYQRWKHAVLVLWDLWKTAAEWWTRFWSSFPLLRLHALSNGRNLVEEAFDAACPGTGFSSRSSTCWSKDSSQSSSTKKTGTPPALRKFKEDPGFFKQRLPLSESDESDDDAGDQPVPAEPPRGSRLERCPSRNTPLKKSPPKNSLLRSSTFERSASKMPPSSQRTVAHSKQQSWQQSSKSLSAARTCAQAKPPQAAHAQQSGRQRHSSYCPPRTSARETREPAIAENSAEHVPSVAADRKVGKAAAVGQNGSLRSRLSGANEVLPGSQRRSLLSLLQDSDPPVGNYHTEINGNRYQVLNLIGRGGSSKVFMMLTYRKKLCAVKLVSMSGVQPVVVQAYMNEVAILKSLRDCERVVRLYDYEYVRKDQVLALVMEKGDQDLSSIITAAIKKGALDPTGVKFYWFEMLQAVREIHEKGVIHSDLKPANFLFVDGKLKLIDFGIASTTQADVTSVFKESPMGTLNFMSPESLQLVDHEAGKHCLKISRKSDVWSLGCILHHLVLGYTPFQHIQSTAAKMTAIAGASYVINFPEISDPNLLDVLKKCLQRNPNQRPTIQELLDHPYLTKDGAKQRNPVLQSVLTEIENLSPASVVKLSKVVKYLRQQKK
ncbi:dual specificity protein kinase monopolar spindle 1 isoform X2 [Amblyomma americanum]